MWLQRYKLCRWRRHIPTPKLYIVDHLGDQFAGSQSNSRLLRKSLSIRGHPHTAALQLKLYGGLGTMLSKHLKLLRVGASSKQRV